MKKFLFIVSVFVAAFIAAFSQSNYAQPVPVVGDYGSVASGNWSSTSTWKQWDGTGWNTVPTGAPGSSHSVFILTGTTVTYDLSSQNTIDLIVESGATFQSKVTLPAINALKINGDTVWVAGNLGGSSTDGLSIETKNNGGNGRYGQTGDSVVVLCGNGGTVNLGLIRPNSSQSVPINIIFERDVNINNIGAGIYIQRGPTIPLSAAVTVDPGVILTFASGSYFGINSSSTSNGVIPTTLNINGTVNMPSSGIYLQDSISANATLNVGSTGILNIGGSLSPYLNGGNVASISVASGGSINMLNGGTADFSNSSAKITGAGAFVLNSGANINVGAVAGLDAASGTIQTTGSNSFNTGANYYYSSPTAQVTGSLLPAVVHNLSVNDTAGITLTDSLTVNGVLNVYGKLSDNNGIKCGDSVNINGVVNIKKLFAPYVGSSAAKVYLSNLSVLNIHQGGLADFSNPDIKISGSGSFVLDSSATINIGAAAGLDSLNGPIQTKGSNSFDSSANYCYVGTSVQATGSQLPYAVHNLTINDTAGVNTTDSLSIYGTLTINGKLINDKGILSNGSAIINGTYQHNIDGGTIPTATWNNGSTCLITGTKLTGAKGANQNFYNFIVKCDSLFSPSYPCHFDMANNTIAGSLIIQSTNSFNPNTQTYYALTGYEVPGSPKTITIDGNLVIDTLSSLAINNFASSHGTESVTVYLMGNLNIAGGGNLSLTAGSAHNLVNLVAMGNINLQNGAGFYSHSTTTDSLIFAGTSEQSYIAGTLSNNNNIKNCIRTGAIVNADTSHFTGSSSTFTIEPGGTFKTRHPLGLNGNLTIGGTKLLSYSANYVYNGYLAQVTGSFLPDTIANLTIDNTGGVVLTQATTINDTLFLTNGLFDNTVPFTEGPKFKLVTVNGSLKNPVTGIKNDNQLPLSFRVEQNYPNPFNPSTTINYSVKFASVVTIKVYNLLGQIVRTLVDEEKPSGNYTVVWDGRDNNGTSVASGAYFYRYSANNTTQIKKMILMK